MPISAIYGLPGKGKSLFATFYAFHMAEKYHKSVVSNYWFAPSKLAFYCKVMNYKWLCENLDKGIIHYISAEKSLADMLYVRDSIVLLDEAGIWIPAKGRMDGEGSIPKKLLAGLCQSRKRSQYLIYICQSPAQVDASIRELTEEVFYANGISVWSEELRNQKLFYKACHMFVPENFVQWSRDPKLKKNPLKTRILATKSWAGAVSASDRISFDIFDSFTELDKQDDQLPIDNAEGLTKSKKHKLYYEATEVQTRTTKTEVEAADNLLANLESSEMSLGLSEGDLLLTSLNPAGDVPTYREQQAAYRAIRREKEREAKRAKNGNGSGEGDSKERTLTIYSIKGCNKIQPHGLSKALKKLFSTLPASSLNGLMKIDAKLENFKGLNKLEKKIVIGLGAFAALIIKDIVM